MLNLTKEKQSCVQLLRVYFTGTLLKNIARPVVHYLNVISGWQKTVIIVEFLIFLGRIQL